MCTKWLCFYSLRVKVIFFLKKENKADLNNKLFRSVFGYLSGSGRAPDNQKSVEERVKEMLFACVIKNVLAIALPSLRISPLFRIVLTFVLIYTVALSFSVVIFSQLDLV